MRVMESRNGADMIDKETLIKRALEMVPNAYAPYSRFHVGAAILCESGNIYTGANMENAAFPCGICAESNAVSTAISRGERKIVAIAVAGGRNGKITDYCAPCGVCRQTLREFCDPKQLTVLLAKSTEDYREMTLDDLLPMSFGSDSLEEAEA